jgi:hypothetical protein
MNIRMVVWAMVAVAVGAGSAWAENYNPTQIKWPGWTVTSSEDLYEGPNYPSDPLMNLFDGAADTAWVFSGFEPKDPKKSPPTLTIAADKARPMTAVVLHCGCWKSEAAFHASVRPSQVRVHIRPDDKGAPELVYVRDVPDAMNELRVEFGRRTVREVQIEITAFRGGSASYVCLSEIRLFNRDQPIDMAMPGVVLFTKGCRSGSTAKFWLTRRDGTRICRDCGRSEGTVDGDGEEVISAEALWSPGGRFVAVIEANTNHDGLYLRIVETAGGRTVLRQPIVAATVSMKWKGEKAVVLQYYPDSMPSNPSMTVDLPGAVAAGK